MYIEKLASQIRNDIVSGLRGYHSNLSISLEQLQDEVVACRLELIKELSAKGIFPKKDLLMTINCIPLDCKSLNCCQCGLDSDNLMAHFEIPQVIVNYNSLVIDYIGSIDKQNQFNIITSPIEFKNKKYRKRGKGKPYVWIMETPNQNGKLDCFVFNAPFLEKVSIIAAFKDPRQLEDYECCQNDDLLGSDTNLSFLDQLIKEKLVTEKINIYKKMTTPQLPNDQQYVTGY